MENTSHIDLEVTNMVLEFNLTKRKTMFRWPQFLQRANFGQIRGAGELARFLQSWHVILK